VKILKTGRKGHEMTVLAENSSREDNNEGNFVRDEDDSPSLAAFVQQGDTAVWQVGQSAVARGSRVNGFDQLPRGAVVC